MITFLTDLVYRMYGVQNVQFTVYRLFSVQTVRCTDCTVYRMYGVQTVHYIVYLAEGPHFTECLAGDVSNRPDVAGAFLQTAMFSR